jgi:hypothetical protein
MLLDMLAAISRKDYEDRRRRQQRASAGQTWVKLDDVVRIEAAERTKAGPYCATVLSSQPGC